MVVKFSSTERSATIAGVIFLAVSISLGLWVGLWLLFVGGIVQFVEAIKASPVSGMGIAIGLLRVTISPLGWIAGTGLFASLVYIHDKLVEE